MMKKLFVAAITFLLLFSGMLVAVGGEVQNEERSVNDETDLVESTDSFVSTWNTTNSGSTDNDQIQLPLESGGNYNFTVEWGDGTNSHITAWDQEDVTHTYPESGEYTIYINGTIEGWSFDDEGDAEKITEISN